MPHPAALKKTEPNAAYKVPLGPTLTCGSCRTWLPCPIAVRLGRTWRKAHQVVCDH
ncbi:hypothetical protein ABT115_03565 [Streptomyces sp. NPDC001832]|uniref:hypothetical protein n=1 Tax=Streptomyces sp. NPDC001832 TaxID=3154527 RepID=UPI00332BB674